MTVLIWEDPIITTWTSNSPNWDWIGFALSIAMICLTLAYFVLIVVCFVRNKNKVYAKTTFDGSE